LGLDQPWGGIFPVAGFFRDWDKGINIHECQNNIKILIGHGINDAIIRVEESEKIYDYLLKRNYKVIITTRSVSKKKKLFKKQKRGLSPFFHRI